MASRLIPQNRGGRPAKFAEPSRPVTVTLPERVLKLLATVNADRAKAIVKLAESALTRNGQPLPTVSTVGVDANRALILISDSGPLRRLLGIRLIEVAPARHLISIRSGTSIESIEVAIHDLLEDLPRDQAHDRQILSALMRILRASRRSKTTTKEEILFVATSD